MKHFFKSIPFIALMSFYSWAIISEYGWIIGSHLTAISISFFLLFTPILSFIYLLGFLPGASHQEVSFVACFMWWIMALVTNILTYAYSPQVYQYSMLSNLMLYLIKNRVLAIYGLAFSGGMLLYHWLISTLNNNFVKAWLHGLGVLISIIILIYLGSGKIHENFVIYMASISNSNY